MQKTGCAPLRPSCRRASSHGAMTSAAPGSNPTVRERSPLPCSTHTLPASRSRVLRVQVQRLVDSQAAVVEQRGTGSSPSANRLNALARLATASWSTVQCDLGSPARFSGSATSQQSTGPDWRSVLKDHRSHALGLQGQAVRVIIRLGTVARRDRRGRPSSPPHSSKAVRPCASCLSDPQFDPLLDPPRRSRGSWRALGQNSWPSPIQSSSAFP